MRLERKTTFVGKIWLYISLSETKRPCHKHVQEETVTVSCVGMMEARGIARSKMRDRQDDGRWTGPSQQQKSHPTENWPMKRELAPSPLHLLCGSNGALGLVWVTWWALWNVSWCPHHWSRRRFVSGGTQPLAVG